MKICATCTRQFKPSETDPENPECEKCYRALSHIERSLIRAINRLTAAVQGLKKK